VGVIIGMDPHKRSATIEVIDERGAVLAKGRFGTDTVGYRQMLVEGRRFVGRVWAVEGCNGIGRHLAHRLVHDGETVFDVPPKLSAQVRVFATGNGRKTDPVDAHSVALRTPGLVRVEVDDDLVVMGMLADRRDELGRARTQTINRLHRLLLELFPGGAKQFLSAQQSRALIATIKPRDLPSKTRRRLAVELIGELETTDRKIKALKKDLTALVTARGSTLLQLHGIGPSSAARLLADIGDIHRFADRDRFASWNGTAPLDASSGNQQRHRLSCAGNRRINRVLHIMAIVQLRNQTERRAYYDARKAGGTPSMMALRALKRRLSNVVFARMLAYQLRREATGPGGQSGTTLQSSATDLTPDIGSSDKPHPGPATASRERAPSPRLDTKGVPDACVSDWHGRRHLVRESRGDGHPVAADGTGGAGPRRGERLDGLASSSTRAAHLLPGS
jgi:transposase